jgi:hypothetical protein
MKEHQIKVFADRTEWHLNGKLHREDGPAIECADGHKEWYINNRLHREDGPAIEYADGNKMWYLNGKLHSEEDWKKKVAKFKCPCSCDDKVVIIDGKKYKLVAMS